MTRDLTVPWGLPVGLAAKAVAGWIVGRAPVMETAPGLIAVEADELTRAMGVGIDEIDAALLELHGSGSLCYRRDDASGDLWIFLPHRLSKVGKQETLTEWYLERLESQMGAPRADHTGAGSFFSQPDKHDAGDKTGDKTDTADKTADDNRGFIDKTDTRSPETEPDPPIKPAPWENGASFATSENSVLGTVSGTNSKGGGTSFSSSGGGLGASEAQRPGAPEQDPKVGVNSAPEDAISVPEVNRSESLTTTEDNSTDDRSELKPAKKRARKKSPRKPADLEGAPVASHDVATRWIDGFREQTFRDLGLKPRRVKWTSKHVSQIKRLFRDGYTIADLQDAWRAQASGDLATTDVARWRRYFVPETVHRSSNFSRLVNSGPPEPGEDGPTHAGESREFIRTETLEYDAPDAVR